VAPAFDIHLIRNIACIQMYRDWGLNHVYFWPNGSHITIDEVSDLNEKNILEINKRNIPIVFIGGESPWREERMQKLIQSFPQAFVGGYGMPKGHIPWEKLENIYRNSQIGLNIHNSSGPINFRTYDLPACGVMQICDNKADLGKIFRLDKEVVGFDTIDECIEKTHYYLDNPEEQREIALAGWQRWRKDYHPDQIWVQLTNIVESHYDANQKKWEATEPVEIKKMLNGKQNSGYFIIETLDRVTNAMNRLLKKIAI
jgi:hypothetical protein